MYSMCTTKWIHCNLYAGMLHLCTTKHLNVLNYMLCCCQAQEQEQMHPWFPYLFKVAQNLTANNWDLPEPFRWLNMGSNNGHAFHHSHAAAIPCFTLKDLKCLFLGQQLLTFLGVRSHQFSPSQKCILVILNES